MYPERNTPHGIKLNAFRFKSINTRLHATCLTVAIASFAITAIADELTTPVFSFNGYGTLGVVHSSERRADFTSSTVKPNGAGFTRQWSADVDSLIAGQITANFTPRLSQVRHAGLALQRLPLRLADAVSRHCFGGNKSTQDHVGIVGNKQKQAGLARHDREDIGFKRRGILEYDRALSFAAQRACLDGARRHRERNAFQFKCSCQKDTA